MKRTQLMLFSRVSISAMTCHSTERERERLRLPWTESSGQDESIKQSKHPIVECWGGSNLGVSLVKRAGRLSRWRRLVCLEMRQRLVSLELTETVVGMPDTQVGNSYAWHWELVKLLSILQYPWHRVTLHCNFDDYDMLVIPETFRWSVGYTPWWLEWWLRWHWSKSTASV